jgi:hypothetical protein
MPSPIISPRIIPPPIMPPPSDIIRPIEGSIGRPAMSQTTAKPPRIQSTVLSGPVTIA